MRKGVAVPYIIAVLLGIAVIGLIGYWLFISGGRIGISSAELQCNNQVIRQCDQKVKAASSGTAPNVNEGWTETGECKTAFPDGKYRVIETSECVNLGVAVGTATTTTSGGPGAGGGETPGG